MTKVRNDIQNNNNWAAFLLSNRNLIFLQFQKLFEFELYLE